jgi:hypothetical protein
MRSYYAGRERFEREAAGRSPSAKVRDIHLELADRYARLARPRALGSRSLQREAAACRQMAKEHIGRPEEPFLLKVASAMEELALIRGPYLGLDGRRPR